MITGSLITGSIVALITPMLPDGSIDWSRLDTLVDWHLDQGTDAIVAVGTTGESATLSVEEHSAVIARIVQRVAKHIPIIAGTGANCTREAIHLTHQAYQAGADAALLVTPYYNKPTQKGLFDHYAKIANSVPIPQILYNVPSRTGVDLLPETVLDLADIPNIVGIKEATGDTGRGAWLIQRTHEHFAVYSGDDATAAELMLKGAKGNISVVANVAPQLMAQLCALAISGDRDATTTLDERLSTLHKVLFCESNPIPVKWALAQMGYAEKGIRLPLTELNPQYHDLVRSALQECALL